MEKESSGELFNDDDINFDLGLEKYGVDVEELENANAYKRHFNGWIEEWEIPLLKKNDAVAEARLLKKYEGLVFHDIDEDIVMTISDTNLEFSRGKSGGWSVIGMSPSYDGTNEEVLEPYLINDNLIEMIMEYEQPRELNVKKKVKDDDEDNSDDEDAEDGDD